MIDGQAYCDILGLSAMISEPVIQIRVKEHTQAICQILEMVGEGVVKTKKLIHGRLQGGDGHALLFGLSEDA